MKTLIFLPFCDFLVVLYGTCTEWNKQKKTWKHWRKEQDPDPVPVYKSDTLGQRGPGSGVLMTKNEKIYWKTKLILFF